MWRQLLVEVRRKPVRVWLPISGLGDGDSLCSGWAAGRRSEERGGVTCAGFVSDSVLRSCGQAARARGGIGR